MLKKIILKLAAAGQAQPGVSQAQIWDFFEFGKDSMEEYLVAHPTAQEDIDALLERVGELLDVYGDDVESAIYEAVSGYVVKHGQWKDFGMSGWFDSEAAPMIDEAMGYLRTKVDDEETLRHRPPGLGYLSVERMKEGVNTLSEAVLDGMQTAEEQYLEDILFKELGTLIPKIPEDEERPHAFA